ncbi:acylphosphatase [Nitrospira sp. NS4]|uniref:acylphosphatase n=1 Tax=Nitrospira sp. NS4 TaxID=3414498 RepID=UPI002B9C4F61|nr:acylphosphatase [Nitrospira sp.]
MTDRRATSRVRAHILVSGRVQGVGYRAFAARVATQRKLVGGARNLDDGRVELDVEGAKDLIESLVADLHVGPPAARVTGVIVEWNPATDRFTDFQVWY